MQHLFQVSKGLYEPSGIISSEDKVLLSVGGRRIHVLQYSNGTFKQLDSIQLPETIVSICTGSNSKMTISLASGTIIGFTWNDISKNGQQETRKSRKRARDYNDSEEDIFVSLLEEPKEVDKTLSLGNDKAFVSIDSMYSLLSSCLLGDMLIAFSAPRCSSCCILMVWKSTGISAALAFKANAIAVLSHKNKCSKSEESFVAPPPFLVVRYGLESNDGSTTPLDSNLFTYLFGPENSLSHSLVVLYGCLCGSVFGCSLKKIPAVTQSKTNTPIQNDSNQELVCCLEQPVLSIHSFHLHSTSKLQINAHNNLVLIGSLGKIVLFTTHASHVTVHETYVNGPLLSSLLIPNYGLLLSSLDAVKKVCLKTECLSNDEQLDNGVLKVDPSIFENAIILVHSPHYLLAHTADSSHLLMMSVDGCVTSVALEDVSPFTSISLSSESVEKQLKDTLQSIQASSDTLNQVEQEVATVDTSLTALNEILTLFRHVKCHSEPSPFKIEACIAFEHTGVATRRPSLEVNIVYTGSRPLRKGCYLSIEVNPSQLGRYAAYVKPKMSTEDNGATYTLALSLEELQSGKELKLKPLVPPVFYLNSRLDVVCYLCYYPPIQTHYSMMDTSEHRLAMIPVFTQSLTLLNFMEPEKLVSTPKHCVDVAVHAITLTIRKTTLCELYEQFIGSANSSTSLSSPSMLACLLTTSKPRYNTTLPSVSEMKHLFNGDDGVELRALLSDGSVIVFRLSQQTQKEGFEGASLTVSAPTLQSAVELTETIVQRIQSIGIQPCFPQDEKALQRKLKATLSHPSLPHAEVQDFMREFFERMTI